MIALLVLVACKSDETLTGYAPLDVNFHLVALNDQAFQGTTTLRLAAHGGISGQATCNRYVSKITVPYPWFELTPIASTKIACIDLAQDQIYFELLSKMTLSEISGDTLILSNDAGETLVFRTPG